MRRSGVLTDRIVDARPHPGRISVVERRHLRGLLAVIVGLHLVGAVMLWALADSITLGLGLLAYLLGTQHAFDADHIALIDNSTRKLMNDAEPDAPRPMSVGFWFACGHSSVVVVVCALLAAGVHGVRAGVTNEDSALQVAVGVVGPAFAGSFLVLLGVLNLIALVGMVRLARHARRGPVDPATWEQSLNARGLVSRALRPLLRSVKRPFHVFPMGALMGLGLDTATKVGLLVLAAGTAVGPTQWGTVAVLVILFAAGMLLFDTLDGVLMAFAYSWSFDRPGRSATYHVAITAISVVMAFGIGAVQLLVALDGALARSGGGLPGFLRVDLTGVGYAAVIVLALVWAGAALVWRRTALDDPLESA